MQHLALQPQRCQIAAPCRPGAPGRALRLQCASLFRKHSDKGKAQASSSTTERKTEAPEVEAPKQSKPLSSVEQLTLLVDRLLMNAASLREYHGTTHCVKCKGLGTRECKACKGKGVLSEEKAMAQHKAARQLMHKLQDSIGLSNPNLHDDDYMVTNRCLACHGSGRCTCPYCHGTGQGGGQAPKALRH